MFNIGKVLVATFVIVGFGLQSHAAILVVTNTPSSQNHATTDIMQSDKTNRVNTEKYFRQKIGAQQNKASKIKNAVVEARQKNGIEEKSIRGVVQYALKHFKTTDKIKVGALIIQKSKNISFLDVDTIAEVFGRSNFTKEDLLELKNSINIKN